MKYSILAFIPVVILVFLGIYQEFLIVVDYNDFCDPECPVKLNDEYFLTDIPTPDWDAFDKRMEERHRGVQLTALALIPFALLFFYFYRKETRPFMSALLQKVPR